MEPAIKKDVERVAEATQSWSTMSVLERADKLYSSLWWVRSMDQALQLVEDFDKENEHGTGR